jgi:hypothetical protein
MHALLLKQHELTKAQEFSHYNGIELMKRRHLEIQHMEEIQVWFNYYSLLIFKKN